MKDLADKLAIWRGTGLITAKQAEDISAFEKRRASASPRVAAPEGRSAPVAEALGYVGAAIAFAALMILLGDRWDNLGVAGRLTVVLGLTVILAGSALALRRSPSPPVQRLVSILAVGVLGGVAWLTTIVLVDATDWRSRDVALTVSALVFVLALALYFVRRRAVPQLAVLVSLIVLVATVFARPAFTGGVSWGALAVWAIGVAWILLALGGWHEPTGLAFASGSAAALIGGLIAAAPREHNALLWLGLGTAVALIWQGIAREHILLVAFGAIGILIFVTWIVLWLFPDGTSTIVALFVVGLGLVLVAVGIARGWLRGRGPKETRT